MPISSRTCPKQGWFRHAVPSFGSGGLQFLACILALSLLLVPSQAANSWTSWLYPSSPAPTSPAPAPAPATATATATRSASQQATASGASSHSDPHNNNKPLTTGDTAEWEQDVQQDARDIGSDDDEDQDGDGDDDQDVEPLVSPILNREIEARVVAHTWPTTPESILCEALVFHQQQKGTSQIFLSNLVASITHSSAESEATTDQNNHNHNRRSYEQMLQLALASSAYAHHQQHQPSSQHSLLAYTLAMRAYSPQCELHRGLARQTLIQSGLLHRHQHSTDLDAVLVVLPKGIVLLPEDLPITAFDPTTSTPSDKNMTDYLLPGEVPLVLGTSAMDINILVIVYANLGSLAFAQAYQSLAETNIPFVVRHLGVITDEDHPSSSSSSSFADRTVLQGYGVRLDIRNVEYKVFDDRAERKKAHSVSAIEDAHRGLINLTSVGHAIHLTTSPFLAGVNLTALGLNSEGGNVDDDVDNGNIRNIVQNELWKIHNQQQLQSQIIPPLWQRRKLPLQAATVIATSPDPLVSLQEISQDLPSLASTLVHVPIQPHVQEIAELLEQDSGLFRQGRLYLNGRPVVVSRPTFNIFEIINILRQEQVMLDQMQHKLGRYLDMKTLKKVHKAWMMGKEFAIDKDATNNDDGDNSVSAIDDVDGDEQGEDAPSKQPEHIFRVDVGRGWKQAIIYLNDVEKDPQYQQWPRSLRQMMMSMQFGMPPQVRRNLFTVLAIIDPIEQAKANVGFDLAMQLIQGSLPARAGILLVSESDVAACAAWLSSGDASGSAEDGAACPIKPIVAKNKDLLDLKEIPATTHAIHFLVSKAASELSRLPGALIAYVEYLFDSFDEHRETQGLITMFDLLQMHANLMEGMHVASSNDAMADAFDALLDGEDIGASEVSTYGKSLRFAAEKGLKPGLAFLNGRPVISSESVGHVFTEEQRYVFGMIMSGEITDHNPKSIYGKLLTGDRVYKKFHPLLVGGGDTDAVIHVQIDHPFDAESLLGFRELVSDEAHFVIEAFLELDTQAGIEQTGRFIGLMDAMAHDPKLVGGISYRVLPRTKRAADAPLCHLLARAATIGSPLLEAAIGVAAVQNEPTLQTILDQVPGVTEDLVTTLLSSVPDGPCSMQDYMEEIPSSSNFVLVNGRRYDFGELGLTKDDVELLMSLEMQRAKAVSSLLRGDADANALGRVVAFLASEELKSSRTDILGYIDHVLDNLAYEDRQLLFSWNKQANENSLQVEVVAIVDPLSEAAQRISPFLRIIRDELAMPFTLLLAPATSIDGDSKVPITSYYRFVGDPHNFQQNASPMAYFANLPSNHVLTVRVDVPEPWNVQQTFAIQDTDNLRCDMEGACGDETIVDGMMVPMYNRRHLSHVEYGLKSLLVFGQCFETTGNPPNGLQLTLRRNPEFSGVVSTTAVDDEYEVTSDGTFSSSLSSYDSVMPPAAPLDYTDTLVMKNVGYWQLRAQPGVWELSIADDSRGAEIFDLVNGVVRHGKIVVSGNGGDSSHKTIIMNDFANRGELLLVKRRPGFAKASLFFDDSHSTADKDDETIHVFSLATGHLYERFLKIMMLSVTKRTSSKVKFWLFENFLSYNFKASAQAMAERIGCQVDFVTYKWPEWLRSQSEQQRIIWGYKILFLDVLFPLNVKKIIYVDADQVVRGDLKELWDLDLHGAPYGYTPFCTSRESTLGYQFWRDGFWKNHLRGKSYHISALYVVDLDRFRRTLVGDQLRSIYQQLSADPNSLSNLDQDLPNYAQHQVPIFSLPQEWLWCESWCSDESKESAKTIDLCNNPMHKEPKVSMAKRIISGSLFNESWVELNAEVEQYDQIYRESVEASH